MNYKTIKLSSLIFILFIVFSVFFSVVSPLVSAVDTNKQYTFNLLSVSQQSDGTLQGGTAKLFLSIKPGTGSVFIESYPTAKIDTQVATRLANEVACEFSSVDCSNYDFFYTIRADAPLIGGPSAGGATALLTLSALEDIPLRKDAAMTGAISSGGIITPVAGVLEKLKAAAKNNNSIAIIPYLNLVKNETINKLNISYVKLGLENKTLADAVFPFVLNASLHNLGIEVRPVLNLVDALYYSSIDHSNSFFDSYSQSQIITPTDAYQKQMRITAEKLCNRSKSMLDKLQVEDYKNGTLSYGLFTLAQDYYNKSLSAKEENHYYPEASFCYTSNLKLRELSLQNMSQSLLKKNLGRLIISRTDFEKQIDAVNLNTFSDLETYSIVKERLLESKEITDKINSSNVSTSLLATAIERYQSGVAWAGFFRLGGEELEIDDTSLQKACSSEIHNVETRLNYLETLVPASYLSDIKTNLDYAYDYAHQNEFALCLFKASKTKADANLYLSSMQLQEASISDLINAKQKRTAQIIHQEKDKGIFPILGFSYYDYVNLLQEQNDSSTSLLFSEYALALSDLQDYFPAKVEKKSIFSLFRITDIFIFLTGLFVGMFIMLFVHPKKRKR